MKLFKIYQIKRGLGKDLSPWRQIYNLEFTYSFCGNEDGRRLDTDDFVEMIQKAYGEW